MISRCWRLVSQRCCSSDFLTIFLLCLTNNCRVLVGFVKNVSSGVVKSRWSLGKMCGDSEYSARTCAMARR